MDAYKLCSHGVGAGGDINMTNRTDTQPLVLHE